MEEDEVFMSDSAILDHSLSANLVDGVHIRLFVLGAPLLAPGHWNARDVQSTFWRFYRNEDPGAYLDLPDGARFAIEAGKSYLVPAGVR
ncbi:MAG: hypothetical protein H7Z41_04795, partial [Cytophagales bacterium]|nr:hypothetical protein [Armatimonadota bacterium]